jgi:hypothetical protein
MPISVGIRFTHAALQVLAEDNGIDLLHIKGPAVDDRLLAVVPTADPLSEAPEVVARHSVDADVLVRPAHVDKLFEVMHRHGWTTAYQFADGSAFEHAATLTHPVLSPADVHRRFPGIGIDASTAFERLWEERHAVPIAGTPCPVPSLRAQRLVLIVHAARGGALTHSDIQRSWYFATEEERAAVQHLADELGAEVALAAGTGRLEEYHGLPWVRALAGALHERAVARADLGGPREVGTDSDRRDADGDPPDPPQPAPYAHHLGQAAHGSGDGPGLRAASSLGLGRGRRAGPVDEGPAPRPPMTVYRIPKGVAFVVPDGEPDPPGVVFLMQVPDGLPQVLQNSAAWIWLSAVEGEPDVADAVAHLVGRARQEVAADVEVFLADLVGRGLLEEGPSLP